MAEPITDAEIAELLAKQDMGYILTTTVQRLLARIAELTEKNFQQSVAVASLQIFTAKVMELAGDAKTPGGALELLRNLKVERDGWCTTAHAWSREKGARIAALQAQDAKWREIAADHVDLNHAHEALEIEHAKQAAQLSAARKLIRELETVSGPVWDLSPEGRAFHDRVRALLEDSGEGQG